MDVPLQTIPTGIPEETTMRYMLIMRSTPEAEKAMENVDFNEVIAAMGKYNESLIKAGVLLAGEGLSPPEEGFVVDFDAEPPVVTDGPYTEAKELFNGFWILDVSSIEEAKQWAQKAPLGRGVRLEVRRVNEFEDFPQDNEWIQKEIKWREELESKAPKSTDEPLGRRGESTDEPLGRRGESTDEPLARRGES
jgi:hypothetical protein